MKAIHPSLAQLETAGLVRVAAVQPEIEYLFRHSLVQDAAYASLLKADRKRLHEAVGITLEQTYPDRLEELAQAQGWAVRRRPFDAGSAAGAQAAASSGARGSRAAD